MRRILLSLTLVVAACGTTATDTEPTMTTTSAAPATTSTTVAPTTTTSEAATTTTVPPRFSTGGLFEAVSRQPVISNGERPDWDWQYTDPGAAIFHNGSIHVFQNGFIGWPAAVGVGYWRSDDLGETWREVSDDPVFDGSDLEYVGIAALASSVIVEDDGTWVLYFYTWDTAKWPDGPGKIGRATAPSPEGPWVADPEPVLVPGPEGAWDELAVRSASVIRDDDGYRMWFAGTTVTESQIGLATSDDGITWVKYDDPATTDPPFAESDPVLRPSGAGEGNVWDKRNVYIPNVVETPDGLVMLYTSSPSVDDPQNHSRKIGIAVSADGLMWDKALGAVINPGIFDGLQFFYSELVYVDGTYVILVEVAPGNNETEVYAASYSGPLPPK